MDLNAFFNDEMDQHLETAAATRERLAGPIEKLFQACLKALQGGGKIFFFGNGGSAADCQHLAAEFTGRFRIDRSPMAAIALTTDTSALTAIGNDYGYDEVFVRQLLALARPGDVAIGISTSGNSANVNKALIAAKENGLTAAGFCGNTGGEMANLSEPFLLVPATDTARIQEMHITLGHILCGALEKERA